MVNRRTALKLGGVVALSAVAMPRSTQALSIAYVATNGPVVAASNAPAALRAAADYACDGTADNADISAAIASLGSPGGVIYLSPGTFTIASLSAIDPGSRLVIQGAGMGATVLKLANGAASESRIFSNPTAAVNDVTIADLTLDGNKANQGSSTGQDGATLSGNRIHFVRVEGSRFTGNGLTLSSIIESSDFCSAVNCRADSNAVIGISFKGATKSVVRDSVATANGTIGFVAGESSKRVKFIGCESRANGSHGYALAGNGGHILTASHSELNAGKGVRIATDNCIVTSNVVEGNAQEEIFEANGVTGSVIANNVEIA